MQEFGFNKFLNAITRPLSKACLDHIFFKCNDKMLKFMSGVYTSAITDHYTTIALFKFIQNKIIYDIDFYNSHTIVNYKELLSDLYNESWDNVINCQDPDVSLDCFYKTLNTAIEKHTTTKYRKVSSKHKKIKPWITFGIIKSIRTRDKLAYKLTKEPLNIELKSKYRKCRNILTSVIKCAKMIYYSKQLEINRNEPKHFWQIIREATHTEHNNYNLISEIYSLK